MGNRHYHYGYWISIDVLGTYRLRVLQAAGA